MHIFYGVQGTGNGHITRARVMAKELYKAGMDVDFQFTGRPFDQYFDMSVFQDYQVKHGLTFSVNNGRVSYVKTAFENKPISFLKEVSTLDLSDYDLVITDFEPVTAWAAKSKGVPILGLGHQYAFKSDIPKRGSDPLADLVMRFFAPSNKHVGLHWHHFGQPILPPIIETKEAKPAISNKILVYLPFENMQQVIAYLMPFDNFIFHIYSPDVISCESEHIVCKPLSREGFQDDLADCAGIISNAGFELASEALLLGKKILVKPLSSQMEQISNAAALEQLGYGHVMHTLDNKLTQRWLNNNSAIKVNFPDTAKILVDWFKNGLPDMTQDDIEAIWSQVDVVHVNH
jgi:uncharacterized protein (TIGR00661 family)